MNYDSMTREELIAYIEFTKIDRSFSILKKEHGIFEYGNIADGQTVIFLDICNMHSMNHLYTMDGVDQRIRTVCNSLRDSDVLIKFGGDEIIILPKMNNRAGDNEHYIDRLVSLLKENDLYAVIASTDSINGLEETVKYLDLIVSGTKDLLEITGKKPNRDMPYTCLESIVV